MFELRLSINGVEDVFQSQSMQTLVREVVDVFDSKDADSCPLPFSCLVNKRGQIVEMSLKNDPESEWWKKNHPIKGGDFSVSAVITKKRADGAEESYDVPEALLAGDGNCWVAIHEGVVVDLVYMRVKRGENFSDYRACAIERLKPKGRIVSGMITTKRFFPKAARRDDVAKNDQGE